MYLEAPRHHHFHPQEGPLVACPLLDFLMSDGMLSALSLERVLTPRTEIRRDFMETSYRITVNEPDLALTLIRTYQMDNGKPGTETRVVTQIELKEYMDNHLPELEARGVLDTQGRLIPQDRMLSVLRKVQELFHTTPIITKKSA